jgi:hypothetical protein
MKVYKLTKEYPNSPELGFTIYKNSVDFMNISPQQYTEFWSEFDINPQIKTLDVFDCEIGDVVYVVDGFNIKETTLDEYSCKIQLKCYKLEEEAKRVISNKINVKIENEHIIGENIKLYGVLVSQGSNWDKKESDSITLSKKTPSQNWKYFRTKQERDTYIELNKPLYSKKQILEHISGENIIEGL